MGWGALSLLLLSIYGCNVLLGNEPGQLTAGAGGNDGLGGDNGAGGSNIGTEGEPCDDENATACVGTNQKVTLLCRRGVWESVGVCSANENCDTRTGLCTQITEGCDDLEPGEDFCSENNHYLCGPDRVSSELVAECDHCSAGACYCPAGRRAASGDDFTTCTDCESGTFSDITNALTCSRCPFGQTSLEPGATSCSFAQIAVGATHICAVLEEGTLRCWGEGAFGKLGYGNTNDIGPDQASLALMKVDVPVGGKVIQVAVGKGTAYGYETSGHHTCVLLEGGAMRCWGKGAAGQLGYGNTDDIETLEELEDVPVGGKVTQIAAGAEHTCALLEEGSVRCWGRGTGGRLGYGSAENVGDTETPESAGDVPVGGKVTQITAGFYHTCALLEGGAVRCWGSGGSGALGYGSTASIGNTEESLERMQVDVPLGAPAVQVVAGGYHTCALLEGGAMRCWGSGNGGRLGYGSTANIGNTEESLERMQEDVPVGGPVIQITAGETHTCALLEGGRVRCWGVGNWSNAPLGNLGYGHSNHIGDDETPESVGDVPVGGKVLQIEAGGFQTCALLEGGAVRCWGLGGMVFDGYVEEKGWLGYGEVKIVGATPETTPDLVGNVPYR